MERTNPTVGYKPFNKALATKVVDMDIPHLWCTQHQLLGSKEMFANNYCFQPVVFLVQREVLQVGNCRFGITLNVKREYKY